MLALLPASTQNVSVLPGDGGLAFSKEIVMFAAWVKKINLQNQNDHSVSCEK
jgi:hypothetical protein